MAITYINHDGSVTVEYEGAVVGTYERNGYHDSDFFAVVATDNGIKHVEYASTRYGSIAHAEVDATPEAMEVAWAAVDRIRAIHEEHIAKARAERGEVGDPVVITGGRKHKGREGTIRWVGESYGESRYRVEDADGDSFFVPAYNTNRPRNAPQDERLARYGGGSVSGAFAEMTRGVPPRPARAAG